MIGIRGALAVLGLFAASSVAFAADEAPQVIPSTGPIAEEEAPPPVVKLERLPPRQSWELGVQMSFGDITYFRDEVPPWAGFGLRFGWGKNTGQHRLGFGTSGGFEGPMPLHFTAALEPHLQWDWISEKGLYLGASAGPSLVVHSRLDLKDTVTKVSATPALAARIGISQGWTRIGRRIFVYIEPKVRWIDNTLNPVLGLVIGQGVGR